MCGYTGGYLGDNDGEGICSNIGNVNENDYSSIEDIDDQESLQLYTKNVYGNEFGCGKSDPTYISKVDATLHDVHMNRQSYRPIKRTKNISFL